MSYQSLLIIAVVYGVGAITAFAVTLTTELHARRPNGDPAEIATCGAWAIVFAITWPLWAPGWLLDKAAGK